MIQARRTDTNLDINEPIGSFTALDEIDAIQDCGSTYGVSFTCVLKESDTGFSNSDTNQSVKPVFWKVLKTNFLCKLYLYNALGK